MAEAYIIPGFGHTGKELPYSLIRNEFNTKNIESKVIRIKWEYRTMKDYISQFLDKCQNPNPRILGFSFGAMVAFISCGELNPGNLFLCSLSPYFREDLQYLPETWKRHLGKRRLSGLEEISFNEIAKKINCSTIVTLGSEESKHAERRANETKKRIKNCQKIIINGANHNIGNKLYLNALKDLIRIYG